MTYIPYCPSGLPEGPPDSQEQCARETFAHICLKAGVDISRVVEPVYTIAEITSLDPARRPPEELIIDRFIKHAQRMTSTRLMHEVLLTLRYRDNPIAIVDMVQLLYQQLTVLHVKGEQKPRRVLLLENAQRANHFLAALPSIGVLQGDLHAGPILHVNVRDPSIKKPQEPWRDELWFVVTWCPTIPISELGNLFRTFLTAEIEYLLLQDRCSLPASSSSFPTKEAPTRPYERRDTLPSSANKHFQTVREILAKTSKEPKDS